MKENQTELELIIPNSTAILPIVIDTASSVARKMNFEEKEIQHIQLGIEEATSIIIKNAFEEGEQESIRILFKMEPIGLGISIFEKGIPFDPSIINEFSPDRVDDDFSDEGLWMYLLKQFMDDFSFINHGKEGRETRLFKYLHHKSVEDVLDKDEIEEAKAERNQEQLPKGSVSYTIRPLNPKEAVEVSRCAYTSYGYTYVHEDIYYPERVREMNQSGDLISYVAINNSNNEVMGHCALEREEDRLVPQIGVAATKPKYRGQGCMGQLNIALIEEAHKREFLGIYGRGITTHPYSQKAMLKDQFYPCAILISSGMERKYKGIEQKKVQRESVVIQMRYLRKPEEHIVYLPQHHARMIKNIYGYLNAEPEFRIPQKGLKLPKTRTKLNIRTNMNSETADIFVPEYGEDFFPEVQSSLKRLCREGLKTIYIYLRIANPITAMVTEDLELMDFFFAGIKPASGAGDLLILQFLNNHQIDYDYIAIGCDESQNILEYIKSKDPGQTQ